MNLLALKLMAPLTALAAFGLVACGESEPALETPSVAPATDAPLDPAAVPTPPDPVPSAPPELIEPGTGAAPQDPLNPTDPNAPPPPAPPPVLPDSPPN